MVNPSSEECSFHFFTRKLHFWFQDNLHGLHWWTNMVDIDLRLIRFRRWYKICHTYVHQAAIGGGTTCPYEQLTPTSPTKYLVYDTVLRSQMLNRQRHKKYFKFKEQTSVKCERSEILDLMSCFKGLYGIPTFHIFDIRNNERSNKKTILLLDEDLTVTNSV